jgi:single-stranded-DNA-specific exonuclease
VKRWELLPPPTSQEVDALSSGLGITKLTAAMLSQRGFKTKQEAQKFLSPKLSDLQPAMSIPNMDAAVDRIRLACKRQEQVGVFGDYDADGIVGTALLILALRELGLDVSYRLPERLTEGYGLSQAGLMDLWRGGAGLIITVDCGISSLAELQWAQRQGLDVIICDHHLPPAILPPATAILNPKVFQGEDSLKDLCGAGVAFKLACAIHNSVDQRWLELAALGTIADVVPLVGENRIIVTHGLKTMGFTELLGLKALAEFSQVDLDSVDSGDVAFRLAPRLNAAGRLGSATPAVELFLADSERKAHEIARQLDCLNRKRQQIETDVLDQAITQVERNVDLNKEMAVVVAGEGWHPGVIGIVASRLVDKWHRPALVISLLEGIGKGSGRSIPRFSLYKALEDCRTHLTTFGGHRLAAGFTLAKQNLLIFRQAFTSVANSRLCPQDCTSYARIDSETTVRALNPTTVRELERLAPFGYGNPRPIFFLRDVRAEQIRQLGTDGAHLRLILRQRGQTLPAIGFGLGERAERITVATRLDVIGQAVVAEWRGRCNLEIRLHDVRTATFPAEIRCQPSDSEAPMLVDWRGLNRPFSSKGEKVLTVTSNCDLVLRKPPAQLKDLRRKLAKVPANGRICLLFQSGDTVAGREHGQAEELQTYFKQAPLAILAEALARLWKECQTLAENC